MFYEDKDVRQHLLNAKVKETPRGWRIVKSTQSAKIDMCIALAMACQAAQDNMLLRVQAGMIIVGGGDDDFEDDDEDWQPCGVISFPESGMPGW